MFWIIMITGGLAVALKGIIEDSISIGPKTLKWIKIATPIAIVGLYALNYEVKGENIVNWLILLSLWTIFCHYALIIGNKVIDLIFE